MKFGNYIREQEQLNESIVGGLIGLAAGLIINDAFLYGFAKKAHTGKWESFPIAKHLMRKFKASRTEGAFERMMNSQVVRDAVRSGNQKRIESALEIYLRNNDDDADKARKALQIMIDEYKPYLEGKS